MKNIYKNIDKFREYMNLPENWLPGQTGKQEKKAGRPPKKAFPYNPKHPTEQEEFMAEIIPLITKLEDLEKERDGLSSSDPRFWDILSEKNATRIKLKAIETRLENMGKLTGFAVHFQTIPKF